MALASALLAALEKHGRPFRMSGAMREPRLGRCFTHSYNGANSSMEQPMIEPLLIAKSKHELSLLPQMANRHGLITGATGTGKTVTLQKMAESFSATGV